MHRGGRRASIKVHDLLRYAIKEAEQLGAKEAEAYAANTSESEVFIENSDIKQAKSQQLGSLGIRVILAGSVGFYSVNRLTREGIKNAALIAVKIARASPKDRYNSLPASSRKVRFLRGIYDRRAESFGASEAAAKAAEMLEAATSYDSRVRVDSGNFAAMRGTHFLANSNGVQLSEKLSTFSWTIMGMAVQDSQVSSFDFQSGSSHSVRDLNVGNTATEFAETITNSLDSRKIASFKGEMLLTPSAANELVEEVISHSINSDAVQRRSSQFAGKLGKDVSTDLLTVEDDATNIKALGAASFDREGVEHRQNVVIEKGVLKKFLYNTYTARKDGVRSTGNAGGSTSSPPTVSTTNFVVKAGTSTLDRLVSEMKKGVLVSRFSGNVNPISGDFSGVVKGGRLVENGTVQHAIKDVMVAGNVFEALHQLNGVSKERKIIFDSILPYMRFGEISFTAS